MFGKNKVYVNYFEDKNKEHTEKAFYGRISEAIKTGVIENGVESRNWESWNARFVSTARAKAENLVGGQQIYLKEWNCRNPYDKERKRNFPYVLIIDFEIANGKREQEK